MRLDDLALKYGTDKSSAGHNYCSYYERHLDSFRYEPVTLLEIGIWEGDSLRMWREWMPIATILGVDKYDRNIEIEGVETLVGDQDDLQTLDSIRTFRGPFDVVIDDASHISSKTISTFKLLFPALKPGGVYVIEDLQTSYDVKNYGKLEASIDPDKFPRRTTSSGSFKVPTAMQFCKQLADQTNVFQFPLCYYMYRDVESVCFYPNICFITKKRAH